MGKSFLPGRDFGQKQTGRIMHTIDLRSDTVTRPTPAMMEAIAQAQLGDDVWGDDPTVIRLQELASEKLGKEDSLFVPSGTMGTLIAALVHCNRWLPSRIS